MRVTGIDPLGDGSVIRVTVEGGYTRDFRALTFCPADVQRFIEDCEEIRQRVYTCKAVFMSGGNVIPFPKAVPQKGNDDTTIN